MTATLLAALLAAASIALEPPLLTFGPAEAQLDFAVPVATTAVTMTPANGVGAVLGVERVGPGRFRARYALPAERFPQVAIFSLELQGAGAPPTRLWASLPLAANATLKIETKPLASVTVAIGPLTFGPASADAKGRLALPVKVPPGFPHADVTALDRAGNRTTTPLDLAVRPFPRVAVVIPSGATPDQPTELELFAIEADGRPLADGSGLSVTAQLGSAAAPVSRGDGAFLVGYKAPRSVSAGRDQLTLGVGGGQATVLEVPLRPGAAAKVELKFPSGGYLAGSGGAHAVEVRVTDAHGNPVPAAKPTLSTDFGALAEKDGAPQLTVPDVFGGRTQLKVRATVDGLTGEATLPLLPGPPASAELSMPQSTEAGAEVSGRLKVKDAFGNLVTTPGHGLEVRVGEAPPAELSPGTEGDWLLRAEVPRSTAPGQLDVGVRAADKSLAQTRLVLLPYQRAWAVSVSAVVAGSWNFAHAAAFSPRVFLGLRLGRTPLELGAEGAFAWYPRQTAVPTSDERNDAEVEMTAWSAALAVRGTLPLSPRFSLHAGASLGAQHTISTVSAQDFAAQTDRLWGLLFRGAAGVGVYLVGGKLLAQVEYAIVPANQAGRVRGNFGGLGLGLGYALSF